MLCLCLIGDFIEGLLKANLASYLLILDSLDSLDSLASYLLILDSLGRRRKCLPNQDFPNTVLFENILTHFN